MMLLQDIQRDRTGVPTIGCTGLASLAGEPCVRQKRGIAIDN